MKGQRNQVHRDRARRSWAWPDKDWPLARFLLQNGARVTLSDQRSADQLATERTPSPSLPSSSACPNRSSSWAITRLSLLDSTDLLLLSGGVSPGIPFVQEARRRGIAADQRRRADAAPLPGARHRHHRVCRQDHDHDADRADARSGRLSGPCRRQHRRRRLIDRLQDIRRGDKVVMELSSFQLELMDRSPAIAAVLNITPNHLDRHPSMSHYAGSQGQHPALPGAQRHCRAECGRWLHRAVAGNRPRAHRRGRRAGRDLFPAAHHARLASACEGKFAAGAFLDGGRLVLRRPGTGDAVICLAADVRLRGRHNLANILAAACLSGAAGASPEAMTAVATSFTGVEHRLEIVREREGRHLGERFDRDCAGAHGGCNSLVQRAAGAAPRRP